MNFTIITHTIHKPYKGKIYAFAPYVREMNLWLKYADECVVVSPKDLSPPLPDQIPYDKEVKISHAPKFSLISWKERFYTLFNLPLITWKVFRAMQQADHIHLRLPCNIGLIATFVQILFPNKPKTVKYAGNWDPEAPGPWSFRLQRKIVANTFLSRNMKVLIYGKWPGQNHNLVPFFTASYHENEIYEVSARKLVEPLRLIYVGALSEGKQPLIAIQTAEELLKRGHKVILDIFGDGPLRPQLENYLHNKPSLKQSVILHGKTSSENLKKAYINSMFLIFASKSEGWPKVVAESMVWKILPITTPVSAVPYMLGYGERGSLIEPDSVKAADEIEYYLKNPDIYRDKVNKAHQWSKQYTLEKFEREIKKILDSFEK